MRVGVVGNRKAQNTKSIVEGIAAVFDSLEFEEGPKTKGITILTGGEGTGVSKAAELFGRIYMLDVIKVEPFFVLDKGTKYDPRHFFVRNRQLVDNCDIVIAFPYQEDSGVRHLVAYANKKKVPCKVLELGEEHINPQEKDSHKKESVDDSAEEIQIAPDTISVGAV